MHARSRTEIDHIVRRLDGLFIVFDDEDGIAEIAQSAQGIEQTGIVALVQADGRLVEHIQNARQARADLAGETNALAFPARQRARGAAEREIIKPHIDEEFQAVADFFQDAARNLLILGRQRLLDGGEPVARILDRFLARFGNVVLGDLHRQRFGLQALAVADITRLARLKARQILAHPA